MSRREDEHLEFKEAKSSFEFDELVKYCVALANENGGKLVLGVTDKFPRRVSGSKAFQNLEKVKNDLLERLRLRVEAEEIAHPDGRVVVFSVPSRPIGVPISYQGAFWMRAGESIVSMTPDQLRKIFDESGPDFSAEICAKATINDFDPKAIEELRQRWFKKSKNQNLLTVSDKQLLIDAELVVNDGITYAALILLGFREALGRLLAQTEVIFEYRSSDNSIEFQQRKEYRQGFLLFYDDIWHTINLRNEVQHYQDGLFKWDVPTFNEVVVREGILNSVAHRNYRDPGSVFIKQFPRKLEIVSPGGFPPGITEENILWQQSPRNRRIAEVFSKCGFVERSGQGVDWMVENSIKEGKQ